MNKNKKIGLVVLGILVLVGVFYGGMVYGKGHTLTSVNNRNQAFGMGGAFGGARGQRNMGGAGGFTTGDVIAKDDKSITLKLMDGGSKIIFFDSATKVMKAVDGSTADLTVGTQVSVTGTANTDGSLNAQSVQIRPAGSASARYTN